MKAFIFDTSFNVVSAWADHDKAVMHLASSKPGERLIFWAGYRGGTGYRDVVLVLDEHGCTKEVKIMPEVVIRLELGVERFLKVD